MNPSEVEKILETPINTWPVRPLVFIPVERSLPSPEKVLPPLFYMAQRGANFVWLPSSRTDVVRNKAVNALLSRPEFDAILMLDCDHVHDPQIVHKLTRWMMLDPEIKIVGGLNYQRRPPYKPAFFTEDEKGNQVVPISHPDELFAVDLLGTGSILIHRSVFTQIEPPWFKYEYDDYWSDYYPGEDIYFSRLCEQAGIKMYVDPEVRSPHIGEQLIDEEVFRRYFAEHGLVDEHGDLR